MAALRSRNLLLVLTVLLGLQFCSPMVVDAQAQTTVTDMVALGVKDPEHKAGIPFGADLFVPKTVLLLTLGTGRVTRAFRLPGNEWGPPALLPTCGWQPAAP